MVIFRDFQENFRPKNHFQKIILKIFHCTKIVERTVIAKATSTIVPRVLVKTLLYVRTDSTNTRVKSALDFPELIVIVPSVSLDRIVTLRFQSARVILVGVLRMLAKMC